MFETMLSISEKFAKYPYLLGTPLSLSITKNRPKIAIFGGHLISSKSCNELSKVAQLAKNRSIWSPYLNEKMYPCIFCKQIPTHLRKLD